MTEERDLFGVKSGKLSSEKSKSEKKARQRGAHIDKTQLQSFSPDLYRRILVQPVANFARGLDYLALESEIGKALQPGSIVRLKLGGQERYGVVWHIYDVGEEGDIAFEKCRPIEEILPCQIPLTYLRFVEKVAHYTFSPRGAVLRMCLSVPEALEPPKKNRFVGLSPELASLTPEACLKQLALRKSAQRINLIACLQAEMTQNNLSDISVKSLQTDYGFQATLLPPLISAGLLIESWRQTVDLADNTQSSELAVAPDLSDDQHQAAKMLTEMVRASTAQPILLDGVTGSGKTEVYFEAIAAALQAGQQVLVLLPEIALSTQWVARFEKRFGFKPDIWHSDIAPAQRREGWRRIQSGRSRVIVGARSALFLPVKHLGLLIVDEEHENSYKQEEGVLYNARDMAVLLGHIAQIPVILASATPSLETYRNVMTGRYQHVILRQRFGPAHLPTAHIIDLRREKLSRQHWIAAPLRQAIEAALADQQQALLFLNRRGYAPLTLCRTCGHRLECPHCSAWLVHHQQLQSLLCHHCGFKAPRLPACPGCGEVDSMVPCGPGVERLQEEVSQYFPDARVALLTSDRFQSLAETEAIITEIANREVDILIGTQIIAKGYHFPHLTLVGIIDADLGLMGGDLRAAEKSYQLLQQVAGRAGRAEAPGHVYLQTRQPDHPVLQAMISQQRDQFIQLESEAREMAEMPPYGRLIAVIISAPDAEDVESWTQKMAQQAPLIEGVTLLGPAIAPMARLRGRYRMRFLIKGQTHQRVHDFMQRWLQLCNIYTRNLPKGLRVHIDVDPYSFM